MIVPLPLGLSQRASLDNFHRSHFLVPWINHIWKKILQADGGITENILFMQMLSDIVDLKVIKSAHTEASCWGAAVAAAIGANLMTWVHKFHQTVFKLTKQTVQYRIYRSGLTFCGWSNRSPTKGQVFETCLIPLHNKFCPWHASVKTGDQKLFELSQNSISKLLCPTFSWDGMDELIYILLCTI